MPDWEALFVPTLPFLDGVVRGTVTYVVLLVLLRIVGQREAGGLGITDVLIIVLVAQAAGPALYTQDSSLADSMVVVVTILLWSLIIDGISYRFPRFAHLVKARPKTLIENGELNRHVMHREFMSEEEVASQLRLHGIEDLNQIERAYLEPNGMVSVITRDHAEEEPVERPAL